MATKAVKSSSLGGVFNARDAFGLICAALYDRFEQKDEIDRRILKAFEDSIDKAPEQTHAEQAVVEKMLATASEIESKGKRIPGTVGESVDKFTKWNQGESSAWGMTKTKMDVSAAKLFAWLWELNTYRRNGKEVDKETHLALAEVMRRRRGMPLTSKQEVSRWEMGRCRGWARLVVMNPASS